MSIAAMLGGHEDRPSHAPQGIGHPPTISILATDQAFDSLMHTFLYSQTPGSGTGFGTDTFCHNPYVDGHKIRGSHGNCKLHMKKCWKWGLEIHHFQFISNISYNIILMN
jgi:hypothetical protein